MFKQNSIFTSMRLNILMEDVLGLGMVFNADGGGSGVGGNEPPEKGEDVKPGENIPEESEEEA